MLLLFNQLVFQFLHNILLLLFVTEIKLFLPDIFYDIPFSRNGQTVWIDAHPTKLMLIVFGKTSHNIFCFITEPGQDNHIYE